MKALSLWQPWAWLVVNGLKSIENRPWNCHVRERILIHAGRRYSFEQYHEVRNWCLRHGFADAAHSIPNFGEIETGGIVGVATIHGVLRPGTVDHSGAPRADRPDVDARWHMTDQFGIVLRDARPTTFVPTPGRQRWWTPPADVVERALRGSP